jgi:hypothetical protein
VPVKVSARRSQDDLVAVDVDRLCGKRGGVLADEGDVGEAVAGVVQLAQEGGAFVDDLGSAKGVAGRVGHGQVWSGVGSQ